MLLFSTPSPPNKLLYQLAFDNQSWILRRVAPSCIMSRLDFWTISIKRDRQIWTVQCGSSLTKKHYLRAHAGLRCPWRARQVNSSQIRGRSIRSHAIIPVRKIPQFEALQKYDRSRVHPLRTFSQMLKSLRLSSANLKIDHWTPPYMRSPKKRSPSSLRTPLSSGVEDLSIRSLEGYL